MAISSTVAGAAAAGSAPPLLTPPISRLLELAAARRVAIAVVDGRLKLTGAPDDVAAVKPHLVARRAEVIAAVEARPAEPAANQPPTPPSWSPPRGSGGHSVLPRLLAVLEQIQSTMRADGAEDSRLTAEQISPVWWLGELADEAAAAASGASEAGDVQTLGDGSFLDGVLVELRESDGQPIEWDIRRAIAKLTAGPGPWAPTTQSSLTAATAWLDLVRRFHRLWFEPRAGEGWYAMTPAALAANVVAVWPEPPVTDPCQPWRFTFSGTSGNKATGGE